MSKRGIFSEKLIKQGVKCIDFTFEDKIYYDLEKINSVLKIFKEYNVQEVHINQFPAMNVLYPACIIANIPYVVYLHMASGLINDKNLNSFNYYSKTYCTYDENIKIFFENAYKIIAITSTIKDYVIKRYNIEDTQKCIVIPNSINFEEYNMKKEVTSVKNLLIVSRFSKEKMKSIINGIKLYENLKKLSKDYTTLTIVGDGVTANELKKYINDNQINDVAFTGAKSNVKDYIEKSDLIIGVDRCILEALTMKRLAIISGYDEMKGLITENIINDAIVENFCGMNLQNKDIKEIAEQILKLTQNEIKEITENNYNIIKGKLDMKKNMYCINVQNYRYNINISEFMQHIVKINYILGTKEEYEKNKKEENWKEHLEYKTWIENQQSNLIQENEKLEKQINENILELKKLQENKKHKVWFIGKTKNLNKNL